MNILGQSKKVFCIVDKIKITKYLTKKGTRVQTTFV